MEQSIPYIGKIHPPYSDNISLLKSTSSSAKAGKIFYAALGATFVAGIAWFLITMVSYWRWSGYAGIAVGVLVFVLWVRALLKSQCASCPSCGFEVGSHSLLQLSTDDKNLQFACERCHEWLVSDSGKVRHSRETDVVDKSEFDCPPIANSVWPNECIVCGAEATQRLSARTFGVGGAGLLLGRLSLSYGSVKNIPYCSDHKDAVSVKESNNKLWLVFKDYSARRRYLYVNKLHIAGKRRRPEVAVS